MKESSIFFSFILLLLCNRMFSQSTNWTSKPFDQKVFIENKGQFDEKNGTESSKILFGARSEGVDLYFSAIGLTYKHDEMVPMPEEEKETFEKTHPNREEKEREERKLMKSVPQYISIEWAGSNPNTKIISEDPVPFYYTYGGAGKDAGTTIKANAYKKIIYKNLYPNIDVEYVFPLNKPGVKYFIILHPGAHLIDVKMKYKNADHLSMDQSGNVIITSAFGSFVDHAPISLYKDNNLIIKSAFTLIENEVTFKIDAYDQNRAIIIDPWTTNPAFAGYNYAYDVNFDHNGNVYIHGSYAPFQLAKLDSTGLLQWVFNAVGLGVFGGDYSYGDFAVDELSGASYLIEGFRTGGARIYKINAQGFQTGTFPGISSFQEMWRAEYNRCINKIVIGGGGSNATNQAAIVDTNLTNISPVNVLSTSQPYHDFALLAIDNNNTCFMATCASFIEPQFDNIIVKCPIPNLVPTAFSVFHGHFFLEGKSSIPSYFFNNATFNYISCVGVNGIAVSPSWLYTYDSDSLKRWDKNTGVLISAVDVSPLPPSVALGGGIMISWSGISADECDNVFVGLGASIKEYNSTLTLNNTFTLQDTVYDIKLGMNNKLYACGKGFVTQIDVASNNTSVLVSQTPDTSCSVCNGTATANISCGNPSGFLYSWNTSPVQTTQTATGLCPGSYTVTVSASCSNNYTGTIIVSGSNSNITLSTTVSNAGCNTTGIATVTPSGGLTPYSYLWSNGQTTQSATSLVAGTYTITVTDSIGCSQTQTVIVASSAFTITTTTTNANCNPNGTATATALGGVTPYTYLWSNGQTTQTATGLGAGTYTVTVTDSSGCGQTQTAIITATGLPSVTASALPTILTQGDNSPLTATGGGAYSWAPSTGLSCVNCPNPQATPLETTDYCVTVTNLGCTDSSCVTITVEDISSFYIPSAFTPNDNSVNDVFRPNLLNVHDYRFLIFDRWGEKIFETAIASEGWNGYYQGTICEQGVYVYKIAFTDDIKNNFHQYIGKLTLLR